MLAERFQSMTTSPLRRCSPQTAECT
jgi:hypothetical protein